MKTGIVGINTSMIFDEITDNNIKLKVNGKIKSHGILDNIEYENVEINENKLDNIILCKGLLITRINLSKCFISNKENDKSIVGIYSEKNVVKIKDDYIVNHSIIVRGKCSVWCSDINGEIEVGDYITSSNLPGIAMKQSDDIKHNYTIGKCIEKIEWNNITNIIEKDGKIIKKVYLFILIK